jgi:magnesium-protoporphyrin O-methyltransferase
MTDTYTQRRSEIASYFDRTAAEAWTRLTSDAPVSRIRETVRQGRASMRETLLSYLPEDLKGARVFDAGCGTGSMALALAERGADVLAIDLSQQMITVAQQRTPAALAPRIDFEAGDMTVPHGQFDYVIAMDSLIHYRREDMLEVLKRLSDQASVAIAFTYAPRTTLLAAMHRVGKLFPRSNRSPSIEPQAPEALRLALTPTTGMYARRTARIKSGFYISQSQELTRA